VCVSGCHERPVSFVYQEFVIFPDLLQSMIAVRTKFPTAFNYFITLLTVTFQAVTTAWTTEITGFNPGLTT
jgi:hypothetical protein